MTWNLSEGGSEFTFEIERAYFATNAQYNDGNTLLMNWEGKTDLDDQSIFNSLSYSCGKGWLSNDGKTAYHEKGDLITNKGFNKSSLMGKLLIAAITPEDKGGLGIEGLLKKRGNSLEAKIWDGLKFQIGRVDISFGPGLDPKNRPFPTAYLGEVGATAVQQRASGTNGGANPAVLLAKVKSIAKKLATEGKSHQEFVDEALSIDGVADDNELLNSIVDENSLWASVSS